MTPQEFIRKWKAVELSERSAAQSHFNDLCGLFEHPTSCRRRHAAVVARQ
jgi:hypothetical protein